MNNGWWPAVGDRYFGSGALGSIGSYGGYWSSTRSSIAYRSYHLVFDYNGYVDPSRNDYRSYGLSVRCVQEEGLRFAWDLGLGTGGS